MPSFVSVVSKYQKDKIMSIFTVAETKFVSSLKDTRAGKAEAAILGDPNWRQCRESKSYGAFNFAQSSELRMACKSYYLGFRPSSVVGAQWLRSIFSPNKAKRALALVAKPRVHCACPA